jgi:beta-glucosidase-like glycosyl hydrolase
VVNESRSGFTNALTSRTFGRDANEVAALAGEFLYTLQSNGVIGCIKHFPGLGAAQVDSHEELPVVGSHEDESFNTDLLPYRELLNTGNVHAVMAAHVAFPNHPLQETAQNGKLLPSSLSYNFVTTLLRGQFAFDGLVITDDLEMGAIVKNFGIGEASKMAVTAGADMLAICADPNAIRRGYNSVLKAVTDGELSQDRVNESLARIELLKTKLSPALAFDPDRLKHLSARPPISLSVLAADLRRKLILRKSVLFVLLLSILTVASTCRRRNADIVTVALPEKFTAFDTLTSTANDASAERVKSLIFNSLVKKDANFDYIGELAKSIKTSDDGLTLTFVLQDGVSFTTARN